MAKMIFSTPRRAYPGDTAYIMSCAHRDDGGRWWPALTEYEPAACGSDSPRNGEYQKVRIEGSEVVFFAPRYGEVPKSWKRNAGSE